MRKSASGQMFATIVVLQLPPRESCMLEWSTSISRVLQNVGELGLPVPFFEAESA